MKSLRALMSVLTVGVALPVAAQAPIRYDETALTGLNFPETAAVFYTGEWHQGQVISNWSGGTAAVSNYPFSAPAVSVTLIFPGTGVTWIGARHPQGGQVNIWVDGVMQTPPNGLFDDPFETCVLTPQNACDPTLKELQAPIFTISGLEPGAHKLEIRPTWTRKDSIGRTISCDGDTINCFVVVDAFDIEHTVSGRLQETGPAAVTYVGLWTQGARRRSWPFPTLDWFGGEMAFSAGVPQAGMALADPACNPVPVPDPGTTQRVPVTTQAVLLFSGTQVAWQGAKGPNGGEACVYIDGKRVTKVDTFNAVEQNATIFTSKVLPRGIHALAIEVTHTRSDGGSCDGVNSHCYVVVDAFDVTP